MYKDFFRFGGRGLGRVMRLAKSVLSRTGDQSLFFDECYLCTILLITAEIAS